MLVIATIPYSAQGLPPRCRNFRRMEFSTDISAEIQDVSPSEAPVAFELECTERSWDVKLCRNQERTYWRPFRSYDGKVWVEAGIPADDIASHLKRVAEDGMRYSMRQHEAEQVVHARVAHWAARHISIDGVLWHPGDEPAIVLRDSYYRQDGYFLSLVTENHELERVDDGAVYRLDEWSTAIAAVARLNGSLDEATRAELAKEQFCLDERVRAIRPELLTRPFQKDYQAQVRYVETMGKMLHAETPLRQLLNALASLTASIADGHVPAGCDAATAARVHALARDLDDALHDRRLSGRTHTDVESTEDAA